MSGQKLLRPSQLASIITLKLTFIRTLDMQIVKHLTSITYLQNILYVFVYLNLTHLFIQHLINNLQEICKESVFIYLLCDS